MADFNDKQKEIMKLAEGMLAVEATNALGKPNEVERAIRKIKSKPSSYKPGGTVLTDNYQRVIEILENSVPKKPEEPKNG